MTCQNLNLKDVRKRSWIDPIFWDLLRMNSSFIFELEPFHCILVCNSLMISNTWLAPHRSQDHKYPWKGHAWCQDQLMCSWMSKPKQLVSLKLPLKSSYSFTFNPLLSSCIALFPLTVTYQAIFSLRLIPKDLACSIPNFGEKRGLATELFEHLVAQMRLSPLWPTEMLRTNFWTLISLIGFVTSSLRSLWWCVNLVGSMKAGQR